MRLALVVVALLAIWGGSVAASSPRDHLRIVVRPQGVSGNPRPARTLICNPAGGTLPGAAGTCKRLAALARPFAPVPGTVMCSQIVSGPQVALVTGSYGGRRIWARFRKTDSCQTERWNRIAFLFRTG